MIEEARLSAGTRCMVIATHDVPVTAGIDADGVAFHHIPPGTLLACAEEARDVRGRARVRIASPAGWVDADALGAAPPRLVNKLDYASFAQIHEQVTAGDHYGLDFPVDLEGLRDAGPEYLTAAFRASGVLASNNSVTRIVSLEKLNVRGASENGLLEVAYARDESDLQTKLFVKFPPSDIHHKFGLLRLGNGEIEFARLSGERKLPVVVPRYYYGDYSSQSGNFILITERVPFGHGSVEPAWRKGYDHEVPEIAEHYEVLARNLAALVGAHKRGDLGYDLETRFPFGAAAPDFDPIADPEPKLDRLIDFIGRIAPRLFAPEVTRPEFLAKWREDVLFGLAHKDEVLAYLLADVDYTGLCHINLNVDNAWFWRDEAGQLRAGLLDWGGAGQASLAQALSGMLMMPTPERHIQQVNRVIDIFVEECAKQGCPPLDRAELYFQYKASIYSTAIFMFITILADTLDYFPESYFEAMESQMDPQLLEGGFYSAVVWIDNMLREWLEEITPGEACRLIVAKGALF